MKPTLMSVGTGKRHYRQYILSRMAERYRIVLVTHAPPTWELPYLHDYVIVDPQDESALIAKAVEVGLRHKVAGVLTHHEPTVWLAAVIAKELGLPHCEPDAAARCRDKYAARRAFQAAGVPSARCMLSSTKDQALTCADNLGYPVVVKPRSLTASYGVSLASNPMELERGYAYATGDGFADPWKFSPGVLIEEFLDGPEISVDCAAVGRDITPLVFAKKQLGYAPFFEETGHIVGPAKDIVDDVSEVTSILRRAHLALDIANVVTHTEIRFTSAGPKIVEVNGRPGGDLIPYVANLASHADVVMASADIACGRLPDLETEASGVAGIRFFYAESSGRIVSTGMSAGYTWPEWLRDVSFMANPDSVVRRTPGRFYTARIGYAVVLADTIDECAARLAEVDRNHDVVISERHC